MKQWVGAPASTTIFVDEDGAAPFDARIATADGDNASFDYLAGTPVFVGETCRCRPGTPPRSSAAPRAGALHGGPFAVTAPGPGTTLTCTITNRQLLSTVQIVKQWDGAPSSTTIFVDQDGVGALRRLDRRDRRRRQRLLRLPALDPGLRR